MDRDGKLKARFEDVDSPVGGARHLLQIIQTEREQNDAEEHRHHNRGGSDAVVENMQPFRQLQVINTVFFIPQFGSDFGGDP
ncbi:Uncharacterised protein [Vibrio cholerae]|nr:Uncharacterised protein [Vibrio cholerae]